jgi:hypothetical protein
MGCALCRAARYAGQHGMRSCFLFVCLSGVFKLTSPALQESMFLHLFEHQKHDIYPYSWCSLILSSQFC